MARPPFGLAPLGWPSGKLCSTVSVTAGACACATPMAARPQASQPAATRLGTRLLLRCFQANVDPVGSDLGVVDFSIMVINFPVLRQIVTSQVLRGRDYLCQLTFS